MSKRLEILKKSLAKKEAEFNRRLQAHFDTVKQANGQPLNDKRNGQATLKKLEKQNDALRSLKEGIEKTKRAIEIEESKMAFVERETAFIPAEILNLVESGELTQWRKHPHIFFVPGVEKARIIWDKEEKVVAHKYARSITDKEQWAKFRETYNGLNAALNSDSD